MSAAVYGSSWAECSRSTCSSSVRRRHRTAGNDTSEAVIGGLVAGLVGGVIQTVLSVALFSMAGGTSPAEIQDALSRIPQLPPEMRDRIVRMFTGGGFLAVAAVVTLPIYAVFGMIGGLLGLAIFRKKPTPPAPTPPQIPQP